MGYEVQEQYTQSKTGREADGEDFAFVGEHFIAVIDGSTSKTQRRWGGETSGRAAGALICGVLKELAADVTAREAVDIISAKIYKYYKKLGLITRVRDNPVERITATMVMLSISKREVWLLGDCQALIGQERIANDMRIDQVMSDARALFLESEVREGKRISQLIDNDTGSRYIRPLLEKQSLFQNNLSSPEYYYPVIDGFSVADQGIITYPIPADCNTVILASDGYPALRDTLEESEALLRVVLERDPLLFRVYRSTKGLQPGFVSFDDRTYIKVRLLDQ